MSLVCALRAVELPLQLTRGRIGRLQLRVPWSRLRSEPVEIVLEDVTLEATLRDTPDADAFARRARVHKRLRLDASELLRGLRASTADGDTSSRAAARPPRRRSNPGSVYASTVSFLFAWRSLA